MSEPTPVTQAPDPARQEIKLTFLGLAFDPHRVIYSTIILMTALAIYDEGTDRLGVTALATVFGIVIGPLFALTMAHAFSDALDLQIKLGRRLSGRDRRRLLGSNLEYMYIGIPPVLLALVLTLANLSANTVIVIVEILGVVSLFFWGVFAARQANLGRWNQFNFGLGYSVMGLIVIGIELVLTH